MIDQRFYLKNQEFITLSAIRKFADIEFIGDLGDDVCFSDIASLDNAGSDDLTFLHNIKYLSAISNTKAKACITNKEIAVEIAKANSNIALLVCDNPYMLYCSIIQNLYAVKEFSFVDGKNQKIAKSAKIAPNVFIGDDVEIGENTVIYPNVTIMPGCKIGSNSVIYANAYIAFAIIGDSVILQSGARIGTDGFGYFSDHTGHYKITHFGRVILGDNVEVGANSTIDRGSVEDTIIGEGTKIDNLVHLAHNVKVGKKCFIVAQVGVAGSSKIGNFVVLGGQVGVSGHVDIGDFVRVSAQSGVTKNLPAKGGDYYGMPAQPKKRWQKEQIALRKLAKNN